ncbi:hypothetical protein [Parashewanella tropica]|uniref:hypothetical protein n=1 Tax=Parashewanella tropica TaxID=2547970 RepID=UPI00105A30F9|nr:hypothetical protein [Parashewanella tropica]
MSQFNTNDKICLNCRFYSHLIGVGLGLRCTHPATWRKPKMPPLIPARTHSCMRFIYREKQIEVTQVEC